MSEKSRKDELEEQVKEYHKEHPEVWENFVRFTLEKVKAGYKHYSAMGVWQRMRWELSVGADGESEFKINNNYVPFYARLFHRAFPQYAGFFRTRHQTSGDAPATGLSPLGPDDYPYE